MSTVLNVAESTVERYVVTQTLQKEGFSVREAGSAREALELARQEPPALVLLDLPDADALELCRQLKADPRTAAGIVVLLAVRFTSSDERIRALAAGADICLPRPEPAELLAQVRALVRCRAGLSEENVRLRQELRDADRRKDEFLAMLGHELRGPLAPVRNAVQILEVIGPKDPNLAWARAMIDRQVGQLSRLVDDLLDAGRVSYGRIELRQETVDLAAVVREAIETTRPLLEARKHSFEAELPVESLPVRGDAVRLAQVVMHLLANAAKYTEAGGRVRLSLAADRGEAFLRVRDNGVGIAGDVLPQVFDLFTQLDRDVARSQGGLGIGLTLVKRLVEMHGGSVAAHSDGPGAGSEFVVRLPLHQGAAAPLAEPPDSIRDHEPHARALRILVVDDNADAAETTAMLLKLWGHDVQIVYDGPAALQRAREARPDVVILDIGLPGLSGREVARQMRDDAGLAGIHLIAATGYGQAEDLRRSREAGFDYHLVKPVDPHALHAILSRLIA